MKRRFALLLLFVMLVCFTSKADVVFLLGGKMIWNRGIESNENVVVRILSGEWYVSMDVISVDEKKKILEMVFNNKTALLGPMSLHNGEGEFSIFHYGRSLSQISGDGKVRDSNYFSFDNGDDDKGVEISLGSMEDIMLMKREGNTYNELAKAPEQVTKEGDVDKNKMEFDDMLFNHVFEVYSRKNKSMKFSYEDIPAEQFINNPLGLSELTYNCSQSDVFKVLEKKGFMLDYEQAWLGLGNNKNMASIFATYGIMPGCYYGYSFGGVSPSVQGVWYEHGQKFGYCNFHFDYDSEEKCKAAFDAFLKVLKGKGIVMKNVHDNNEYHKVLCKMSGRFNNNLNVVISMYEYKYSKKTYYFAFRIENPRYIKY